MEKIKELLKNKNKKIENLVAFLVILIITLIIINNIIRDDEKAETKNYPNAELAINTLSQDVSNDFEKRLENILSKIDGVGEVSVMITYSQTSEIVPIYNENISKSVTEETDNSGGVRTISSEDNEKKVVTGSDSNPVTGKTINPKIEGAVVAAKGANNANVKSNIISAVEAVTGLATHKIQVFEMSN